MKKDYLHGWSCMLATSYAQFNLTIAANPDNAVFGVCRHMDVCGWPETVVEMIDVAQALSLLECDRVLLNPPLPAGDDDPQTSLVPAPP